MTTLGASGYMYRFKYKLPDDVSGRVLLQWYYITANSCSAPGYDSYPFPTGWDGAPTCAHIPEDGMGVPEQFWNCGEVFIYNGSPTDNPTHNPVPGPVSSPTSNPVPSPVASPTSNPTSNPIASPTVTPPADQIVVGYYQSWQQYDRGGIGLPQNMDFTKLDRVNFAYFQTDMMGNIFGTDSFGDPLALFGHRNELGTKHCSWDGPNEKTCNKHDHSTGLISIVHAAGAKVYLSIGSWVMSANFAEVASSASARSNFANQCAQVIQEYGFDGIDIDWEYPEYCDKMNFNLLLDEVRLKLNEWGSTTGKTYGLTAALPCGPSNIDDIDIPHISAVVDEILLISHDLHGPWDEVTGVHAPLYYQGFGDMQKSVDSCVQKWKNDGAATSKIALGISFYGRSYAYAMGLNTPHSGNDVNNWAFDEGIPPYYSILDKMAAMTSVRHDISKTQYAFFNCGDGFVSYDDERAICEKTKYTIDQGLRGLVIRELSGDLMLDLTTPLLDMVNGKLQNPGLDCVNGEPGTDAPSPSQTFSPTTVRTPTVSPTPGDGATCTKSYSGLVASSACSHFQHCISGHLFAALLPCPEGTLFDETLQVCNYDYSVWCNGIPPAGVPLCPSNYSGLIAVDDCTGFRVCTNGIITSPFAMCSDSGLLFNEATQSCELPSTFICGSSAPTAQPSKKSPTSSPTSSDERVCPADYTGKLATANCAGYRQCTKGEFSSPEMLCPSGLQFNEDIQNCAWPYTFTCEFDEPAPSTSSPTPQPTISPTPIPTKTPTISPTNSPIESPSIPSDGRLCPAGYTGKVATENCFGWRECVSGSFSGKSDICYFGKRFNEALQSCNPFFSFTCENLGNGDDTSAPSPQPTASATTVAIPTKVPTFHPTTSPTATSTMPPTAVPTEKPTKSTYLPTISPTKTPTIHPTAMPTKIPTKTLTSKPTISSGERACPAGYTGKIATENCIGWRECIKGSFSGASMDCTFGKRFNEAVQLCKGHFTFTCKI